MSFHVICPSLRCRKILTLNDEARGALVTCRYCSMQFRVPQYRAPAARNRQTAGGPNHLPARGTVRVK
jgi:hypothetical protein